MLKFSALMIDGSYYYCVMFNEYNQVVKNVKIPVNKFKQWRKGKLEV